MKKRMLLVSVIATMGLGTFLVSCDKDEDNGGGGGSPQSCRCTYTDEYGSTEMETVTPNDMQQNNLKNCGDVKRFFEYYGMRNVSCNPA